MRINRRLRRFPEIYMEITGTDIEFSIRDGEIHLGKEGRRYLKNCVRAGECHLDLKEGYHSDFTSSKVHGIHFLYELFVVQQLEREIKTILDKINPFCGSFFVCGRYLLNEIDDALWMREKEFEIVGMRKNDMIYIGLNRDFAEKSKKEPLDKQKLHLHSGLNFPKLITDEGELGYSSFEDTHSVLRNMKLVDKKTNKEINILVSSTVRAFVNDEPIEVHTRSSDLDQNFWTFGARKWWWRSKLSGSKSVLYGLRDKNQIVHTLKEIEVENLLTVDWKYHPSATCELIYKIFTKMGDILLSDGDFCSATYKDGEINFQQTDVNFLKRSKDW